MRNAKPFTVDRGAVATVAVGEGGATKPKGESFAAVVMPL